MTAPKINACSSLAQARQDHVFSKSFQLKSSEGVTPKANVPKRQVKAEAKQRAILGSIEASR